MDAVLEDDIVAQNLEDSPTNVSAFTTVNSTQSTKASPQLKLPMRIQSDAPQDLDLVSWPPRKRLPAFGNLPFFVYDVARGIDTYVYVIDNGINEDNAVRIQSSPRMISFLTQL